MSSRTENNNKSSENYDFSLYTSQTIWQISFQSSNKSNIISAISTCTLFYRLCCLLGTSICPLLEPVTGKADLAFIRPSKATPKEVKKIYKSRDREI